MIKPEIEIREYTLSGMNCREEMAPPMWVLVDTYTPHSCPWDCYGRKHQAEYRGVLSAVGIECILLETRQTIVNPHGSGPGGSVRFGDNMLPTIYRIVVYKYDGQRAEEAIDNHKEAIQKWIDGETEIPEACRA